MGHDLGAHAGLQGQGQIALEAGAHGHHLTLERADLGASRLDHVNQVLPGLPMLAPGQTGPDDFSLEGVGLGQRSQGGMHLFAQISETLQVLVRAGPQARLEALGLLLQHFAALQVSTEAAFGGNLLQRGQSALQVVLVLRCDQAVEGIELGDLIRGERKRASRRDGPLDPVVQAPALGDLLSGPGGMDAPAIEAGKRLILGRAGLDQSLLGG